MKIRLGARCRGMNEAAEEVVDIDETTTEEEKEQMALDHAVAATGLDYWFENVDEAGL